MEVDCTDRHGGQSEIPGLLPTADGNQRQIRNSERKGKIITIYLLTLKIMALVYRNKNIIMFSSHFIKLIKGELTQNLVLD